jgi:hypothetical protein
MPQRRIPPKGNGTLPTARRFYDERGERGHIAALKGNAMERLGVFINLGFAIALVVGASVLMVI